MNPFSQMVDVAGYGGLVLVGLFCNFVVVQPIVFQRQFSTWHCSAVKSIRVLFEQPVEQAGECLVRHVDSFSSEKVAVPVTVSSNQSIL